MVIGQIDDDDQSGGRPVVMMGAATIPMPEGMVGTTIERAGRAAAHASISGGFRRCR